MLLSSLGANRRVLQQILIGVSFLLAFIAGIFWGYETNLQPWMGQGIGIKGFAALVLGGMSSLSGVIIGAFCIGLIENFAIGLDFGAYTIPAGYKDAVAFLLILLVLLICPKGLFGSSYRKV